MLRIAGGVCLSLLLPLVGCAGQPEFERMPVLPLVMPGQEAPDFKFITLDGRQVTRSSLNGEPFVLTFLASWCEYCDKQAPDLEQLYQRCRSERIPMFLVGINGYADVLAKRAQTHHLTAPIALSPEMADAYGVVGVPRTFFVNREGDIAWISVGAGPNVDLERGLERIL
jgi:cytochrome c biogenesis protein CcmG/thiol:disulfide interchange protein DsbE